MRNIGITLAALQMVDPADDTCATFVFTDEDHTLGNIVRQFLAQK